MAFLENGELKKFGKASNVVATYIGLAHEDMNQELTQYIDTNQTKVDNNLNIGNLAPSQEIINKSIPSKIFVSVDQAMEMAEGSHRYGDGGAKVLDIKLLNSQNLPTIELESREEFTIQASILFNKDLPTFCFGYLIRDIKGIDVIGTTTLVEKVDMPPVKTGHIYVVEMKIINMLNAGVYSLTFALELPIVINQQHIFLDWINDALVFKVNLAEDPCDRFASKVYIPAKINSFQVNI